MALPAPNLDDRRFQDLVDDAKRMVQRSCPEWTDHNVSDPGVTLIETFAFMTDQLLYRLNRVPDRLRLKFLDLIGLRMFPPAAAHTDITFWLSTPALTPMAIPAGTEVGTIRTEVADSIVFSLRQPVEISPCRLQSLRTKAARDSVGVDRVTVLSRPIPFTAFCDPPMVGDELLIGLDTPVAHCAVRLDLECHVEGLGVDPTHPPLIWQAWTADGWTDCEIDRDETGGINRDGAVILHIPAGHRMGVQDGDSAAWLRAQVVAPEPGQTTYTASPTVTRVTACTVGATGPAINAEIVELETLGESEGVAGQSFRLAQGPVLSGVGDMLVEVSSPDGWQQWHAVEHFAASGPEDRHFTVDGYTGEVLFGPVIRLPDGATRQHGAVPPKGETTRVRHYAIGGGVVGNVAAGTIRSLRSSVPFVAAVENRRSAHGGVDAETLDEAVDRGPLLLRTRNRAVTAEDYEVLAREAVPQAARVKCITAGEADVAAGSVKMLVVPAAAADRGRMSFADLVPSQQILARLAERLDEVRLIGTSVIVEPPLYGGVTVVARVVALPRADAARIRDDALEALYRYLNPLPGNGPDGRGWPFGRAVRIGDLHVVLQAVRGVEFIEDVRLFGANPVTGERGSEQTRIDLAPNSLVFSFDHQVRVEVSR